MKSKFLNFELGFYINFYDGMKSLANNFYQYFFEVFRFQSMTFSQKLAKMLSKGKIFWADMEMSLGFKEMDSCHLAILENKRFT